jgi:hypothetical protein
MTEQQQSGMASPTAQQVMKIFAATHYTPTPEAVAEVVDAIDAGHYRIHNLASGMRATDFFSAVTPRNFVPNKRITRIRRAQAAAAAATAGMAPGGTNN